MRNPLFFFLEIFTRTSIFLDSKHLFIGVFKNYIEITEIVNLLLRAFRNRFRRQNGRACHIPFFIEE